MSAKSERFKLAWYFGQLPFVGRWMWTCADSRFVEAWRKGLERLGCPGDMRALGILGEPGDEQKLVIVTPSSPWAVKVAVGRGAAEAIQIEAQQYEMLQASNWAARHAVPKVHIINDDMLLLERLEGEHPQWDDRRVHRWIKEKLTQDSSARGVYHGDVTPWNIIASHGSFKLLDWEKADSLRYTSPTNNLLDYVLRGAAVRHVRREKVHRTLAHYLGDVSAELDGYRQYRHTMSSNHVDSLSMRVDAYMNYSVLSHIDRP
jgi:hypothetical protein